MPYSAVYHAAFVDLARIAVLEGLSHHALRTIQVRVPLYNSSCRGRTKPSGGTAGELSVKVLLQSWVMRQTIAAAVAGVEVV